VAVQAGNAAHAADIASSTGGGYSRLAVDNTSFVLNGKRAFLSGVNQPWLSYGADFGNNQTNGAYCTLRETLKNVTDAGGNSIRFWLFVEGDAIPAWGSGGKVVATDAAGSLVRDVVHYVRAAAAHNVVVFFCLWNGAVLRPVKTPQSSFVQIERSAFYRYWPDESHCREVVLCNFLTGTRARKTSSRPRTQPTSKASWTTRWRRSCARWPASPDWAATRS